MADEQQKKPAPGESFQAQVPANTSIEDVRALMQKKSGLGVHIQAKFGPMFPTEKGLSGHIVAVDDPFLEGTFSPQLATLHKDGTVTYNPDVVTYFGYFKEAV